MSRRRASASGRRRRGRSSILSIPNRDDAFYFCTACHGFKLVAAQGMSRERWDESLTFMVKRHNMPDVQGEDREKILDYLETAFPERPVRRLAEPVPAEIGRPNELGSDGHFAGGSGEPTSCLGDFAGGDYRALTQPRRRLRPLARMHWRTPGPSGSCWLQ